MHTPLLALLLLPAAAPAPAAPAADVRPVVAGNTRFACDLYAQLRDKPGNLALSPYSISTSLALTSAGARNKTLSDMEKTLHLPPQKQLHPALRRLSSQLRSRDGVSLSVANALWTQKGKPFAPGFLALAKVEYAAGAEEVDFVGAPDEARARINKWVETQTNKRIRDLMPPDVIKPDTRLVLTNALHFAAGWSKPFPKDNTSAKPFHLPNGRTREVQMMRQRETFRYHGQKDFQALELPYGELGDVSLYVLLPTKADGVADVEKLLTPDVLARLTRNMKARRVEVQLPRFKVTSATSLGKELRALGMGRAFGGEADLSGLCDDKERLSLADVVHKAHVEIHEKGSEAGAGSGSVAEARSIEFVPIFRADRPFVFFIRDNRSGSVLFLGRVSDPTR